jgi:hypothetical protein
VLGLPDGITAIKDNFVKQHAAHDGPWKRDGASQQRAQRTPRHDARPHDRSRVSAVRFEDQSTDDGFKTYSTVLNHSVSSIQPRHPRQGATLTPLGPLSTGATTLARNTNSSQSVTQDTVDDVQEDPLQGYRSSLVNRFIASPAVSMIVFPNVSSIIKEHPALVLPTDGPVIDDALLDGLYDAHMVSKISMALPKRNEIKRSDYVWFHLDTGATCTVSHCSGESHCPTPTPIKCGTAADGPSHVVESLGYLIGDFETSQSTMVPFEIPDHATIPSFKRRSMSLHALKDVGFDVTHSLLEKGNFLTIRRAGSDERFQSIPLSHMADQTMFESKFTNHRQTL